MPLPRGYWKLTGKVFGVLVGAVITDILVFTANVTFEGPLFKYCLFPSRHNLIQLAVGDWFLKSESVAENFWVHFWGESEFFQGTVIFFLARLFPMQICNLIYLMADSELCSLKNQSKIVIIFSHGLSLHSCYHLSYFFNS